jgi:SAM-dependent methyltransferase
MPISSVTFNAPRSYDEQLAPVTFGPFARELVARVPADCAGPVLELACGTGAVTRLLRARLPRSTELVATDLSPVMLDYARTRPGGAAGIRWQAADMQQLPFEDASFSTIVCGFGFMFAPDRPRALGEARRVLAPGGRLYFSVWDRIEQNPHALANARVVEALFPDDPHMKFRLPYELHDEDVLRGLLVSARFGEPAIETVRIPITGVDPHAVADGQVRGTPRSALLLERGVALEGVIEAIAAQLARAGGNPYSGHAQAKLVEATAVPA